MADNKRAVGSVTYRDAEHGYFERRKLRRHAAFWSLWALGVGAGALYGVLRPRVESARLARGLAFGTVFWLVMDEGAVYALKLTPGPRAFPWQTHARGLAGHLAFGTVANATLGALQLGSQNER